MKIINIRSVINEIKNSNTREKVSKTNNWLLENLNKIYMPLGKLTFKKEDSNK